MPARKKGRKVAQKKKLNAGGRGAPVARIATTTATTTTRKRKATFPSFTDGPTDGSSSSGDNSSGRVSDDDDGDGSDIGVRASGRKGKSKGKGKGKGKGIAIAQVTIDSGSDEGQEDEEGGADDEEDDMQWEDVLNVISAQEPVETAGGAPSSTPNPKRDLELTLNRGKTQLSSRKKKGASAAERQIRLVTHCLHVQYLLFHGSIRNRWLCDPELQAILLSHLSPSLLQDVERLQKTQGKHSAAGKSPGGADPALKVLASLMHWWKKRFTITRPGLRKNGYKPMSQFVIERDEVLANRLQGLSQGADGGFKFTTGRTDERGEPMYTIFKDEGERVESLQEFREMARECSGSRDVGAVFFTALLRALGLEARMVFSLQPLGFGFTERETFSGKVHAVVGSAGGGPEGERGRVEGGVGVECEKRTEGNGKKAAARKPARKPTRRSPRKSARKRQRLDVESLSSALGSESEWSGDSEMEEDDEEEEEEGVFVRKDMKAKKKTPTKKQLPEIEPTTIDQGLPYPIFWTEVYSPTTSTWITIDPLVLTALGSAPDILSKFEPKGKNAVESKQVIAYVLAYSDNGTAKDVTVRYLAKNAFPGKAKGFRILPSEVPVYDIEGEIVAMHKRDWFGNVMRGYQVRGKPKLERDVKEDEELVGVAAAETKSFAGNGRESIGWYKDHPEYILERHLKRDEAIKPGKPHVKIFISGKGAKAKDEKVYSRQDMVSCKSVENWYREGRVIKEGEQALKKVKPRAATLNRKREIEDAQRDGETVLQGLYSLGQTEEYSPPDIINGEIPRNKYGNIDIYTQSMIPAGAVHLPLKGSARVAKKLKISYADAVTGFEFMNRRAAPYIDGIVIAAENEDIVRDAWEEEQVQRKIKEDGKREKAALTLWRRFIVGLRIVQRLHEVYEDGDGMEEVNPFTAKKFRGKGKAVQGAHNEEGGGGGFINSGASDDEPGGFTRGSEDEDMEMSGGGGFLLDIEEDPSDKAPIRKNSIPTQAMSMREMLAQKQRDAQSIFDSEEEPEDANGSMEPKSSPFVDQTPPATRKRAGKKKDPVVVVVMKKPAEPAKKNPKRKAAPKTGTRSKYFVDEPANAPEEVFTPRRSLRKRG
ncbi:unnamed protein product [Tuber aestivum]|uniref:Rad4 beta-hairpin domain-containing protein n=1 Tax=Tuber aestivum TaxID=59557 RepID=A0A292PLJ8_9PEZI|nr:unnamed protein product [Tuber aestivum]